MVYILQYIKDRIQATMAPDNPNPTELLQFYRGLYLIYECHFQITGDQKSNSKHFGKFLPKILSHSCSKLVLLKVTYVIWSPNLLMQASDVPKPQVTICRSQYSQVFLKCWRQDAFFIFLKTLIIAKYFWTICDKSQIRHQDVNKLQYFSNLSASC